MPEGIIVCTLIICYLYTYGQMYVMSDMFHIDDSGALDMRTRIRLADWCARGSEKASLAGQSVNLELSTGADVFVI